MKSKKTHPSRKPNTAPVLRHPVQLAMARIAQICPAKIDPAASEPKKLPPYIIDSIEQDLVLVSPTGASPRQRARVTFVMDRRTTNVLALTAHFEPDYDLKSAGGNPEYDSMKHAAAEIEHFRRLFPGQTN